MDGFAFEASGEMGKLINQYPWATTSLGDKANWPVSLRVQINLMLASRFPMLIFWGQELITFYNDAFRPSLGVDGKHPSSLAQRGEESWAESWPTIGPMIRNILAGGESVWYENQKLPIYRDGKMTYAYWTYSFSGLRDDNNNTNGVLVTCMETTQQVEGQKNQQEIETLLRERETFSKTVFQHSPVAKAVFIGPDMIIREVNHKMLEITGKSQQIVGNPAMEAITDLKLTRIFHEYLNVLYTGESCEVRGSKMLWTSDGAPRAGYYNYELKALTGADEQIQAVMWTIVDVTDQIESREKLAESENFLRSALELAELGTWSIDVINQNLWFSERMIEWFGYDPKNTDYKNAIPILSDFDRERVATAVARALAPDSGGMYEETYTVIHPVTGIKRILHAQGKVLRDANGKSVIMNGTAQDVTLQKEMQLALENEVQERTVELAATNEELVSINEELEEFNLRLAYSNEELERYAYVASHDLQEPLRKIRIYSDLVLTDASLDDANRNYINKISQSAARMSLLIRDLLAYSRLSAGESAMTGVDLNLLVSSVWNDFELVVREKLATLQIIGDLPVVEGIQLQLNQLFYNLIGNALKFVDSERTPHLQILANSADPATVSNYFAHPIPGVPYYQISIVDNGIGFDPGQSEHIFEVFKRLHSRDVFAGSGIGLALCRRIAVNHHGVLFAHSRPGEGSTFTLLLPVKQG